MSKKYREYSDPMTLPEEKMAIPTAPSKPQLILPSITVGDRVTISQSAVTVNSTTIKPIIVHNATSQTLETPQRRMRAGGYSLTASFKTSTFLFLAFDNAILTDPSVTDSFLTLSYAGRKTIINYVPVFFVGNVKDISGGTVNISSEAFARGTSNTIISLDSLPLGLMANDTAYRNKLAYLFFNDATRLSEVDALLSNESVENVVVTDTNKSSDVATREAYMRQQLALWGIPSADLTGSALTEAYEKERTHRTKAINEADGKGVNDIASSLPTITQNPQRTLSPPTITHEKLPETGFRKYGGKILALTIIAGGIVLYRRMKDRGSLPSLPNIPVEALSEAAI